MKYSSLTSVCLALCLMVTALPSVGHETDQYTLPVGRQFADLGDHFNAYFTRAIERAVEKTNRRIHAEVSVGRDASRYQSPEAIAAAVNREFPAALFLIEHLDNRMTSNEMKDRWPGMLPGYKPPPSVSKFLMRPINPLRAWDCTTLQLYGVYLGTDKLGHFTDMGMHYYRGYISGLRRGETEEQAVRRAIAIGRDDPIRGESKLLGYWTAGAYSNADMAINYLGMVFYRNLTEPQMLKGEIRPPMLERDGDYWKVAPHIRRDSDWFSYFISDHMDEALNPSHYLPSMREGMRKVARDNASGVLEMRLDPYGNRRPQEYYRALSRELKLYWGVDYGHVGGDDELVQIADYCFPVHEDPQNEDPLSRDSLGRTPLHVAAELGETHVVATLLERGADVNAAVRSDERFSSEWGNTPLHLAALNGREGVVALLLDHGAKLNAVNDRGATPLHLAVEHPAVVALLLDRGADRDARDARGRTVLHWAAIGSAYESLAMLLDRGAAPEARDHSGQTAAHLAAANHNGTIVAELASRGADLGVGDSMGVTPLHLVMRHPARSVAEVLIDAGAPLDARDQLGCTPLHEAVRQRADTIVAMLLDAGAEPSLADAFGATPLHLASRTGDQATARLLLEHGADAHVRSASRGTPIDEARRAGNMALVAILKDEESRAGMAGSNRQ